VRFAHFHPIWELPWFFINAFAVLLFSVFFVWIYFCSFINSAVSIFKKNTQKHLAGLDHAHTHKIANQWKCFIEFLRLFSLSILCSVFVFRFSVARAKCKLAEIDGGSGWLGGRWVRRGQKGVEQVGPDAHAGQHARLQCAQLGETQSRRQSHWRGTVNTR